jgi:hypothetical protein
MRLKANIGKPGAMQHRPEAITAAKEVVTGGRSGQIGEPGAPAAGIRLPRIVWAQAGWWDAPAAAWLAAQPQPAFASHVLASAIITGKVRSYPNHLSEAGQEGAPKISHSRQWQEYMPCSA